MRNLVITHNKLFKLHMEELRPRGRKLSSNIWSSGWVNIPAFNLDGAVKTWLDDFGEWENQWIITHTVISGDRTIIYAQQGMGMKPEKYLYYNITIFEVKTNL
jgi:hypothetical protein